MAVWWGTEVECHSAIARKAQGIPAGRVAIAESRLASLKPEWHEVEPSEPLRRAAIRAVRTHGLRAADALQLAAATVFAEDEPGSLPFVTLDDGLAEAARREGFPVVVL